MTRLYRAQCGLYDCLLKFQNDDLVARYEDEMRWVFQEQLGDAHQRGPAAIFGVWLGILAETIALTTPRYATRLRIVLAACLLTCGLALGTALGFCTLSDSPIVHACSVEANYRQGSSQGEVPSGLVQLPDGHRMFFECSGDPNAAPTVILAMAEASVPLMRGRLYKRRFHHRFELAVTMRSGLVAAITFKIPIPSCVQSIRSSRKCTDFSRPRE